MPLYEYQCQKCKQRIEVIQRLNDPPQTICPNCGGELKKLFSAPAIQFKGSGFYKTDYASASNSKGTESKGETKSESKSESKSEAKTESKAEAPKGESKSSSE
jgi:putative FmdB family regulatory protein